MMRITPVKTLDLKPLIKIDDLEKLDVRVGTIEKVEEVEESEKLVRLFGNYPETTNIYNFETNIPTLF